MVFTELQCLNTFPLIKPIGDPLGVAIVYAWALLGILGVHEAGHLIAARWHKIKTTWPYFIPGIPLWEYQHLVHSFSQEVLQ